MIERRKEEEQEELSGKKWRRIQRIEGGEEWRRIKKTCILERMKTNADNQVKEWRRNIEWDEGKQLKRRPEWEPEWITRKIKH